MWCLRLKIFVWACLVLVCAVTMGRLVQVLTVDGGGLTGVGASQDTGHNAAPYSVKQDFNGTLESQTDGLIWFMQVSDLHLSIWQDDARITQFRDFCRHTVPVISPSVVLASGDLTDAKSSNGMGSCQYEAEWQLYSDILRETGLFNTTVWFDVRGNHDNFDLPSLSSPNNLFASHSVQGAEHQRSYLRHAQADGISVAFIAVDATPLPGPKRPFNFVGVLPPTELALLQQLAQNAVLQHDYTVWFGHYPTSCIIGPSHGPNGVRGVMYGSVVYLCGHLHSLGGLVPAMYTRQHTGVLELELEDWKDGRMYRVMALDHGLFTFTDVRHGSWPVILITNPRNSLFTPADILQDSHFGVSLESTHLRVLVWSAATITRVVARIDKTGKWMTLNRVRGPLYVAEWEPTLYRTGLHSLDVVAEDSDGRKRVIEQPFSFDGTQPSFRLWPRVLLMLNVSAVFQFLFGCSICVMVLILCGFKYLHFTVAKGTRKNICRGGLFRWRFLRGLVRKIWLLVSVDTLFWPLVLYILYLPVGPWMVGELLDGHYGVVFAWGTFVYSSFLPGSLSFAYGFALIITFFLPLTLGLAHCVDCRLDVLFVRPRSGLVYHLSKNLPLLLPIATQSFLSYLMFLAYGWCCVAVGPIRSWTVVLGLMLWIQAERLPPGKLQRAAELWYGDSIILMKQSVSTDMDDGDTVDTLAASAKRCRHCSTSGPGINSWLLKGDAYTEDENVVKESCKEYSKKTSGSYRGICGECSASTDAPKRCSESFVILNNDVAEVIQKELAIDKIRGYSESAVTTSRL